MCHNNSGTFPASVDGCGAGSKSCDNIDWLPKFRKGYVFTPISSIINAFSVRSMQMMSELANVTGRSQWGARYDSFRVVKRGGWQEDPYSHSLAPL